MTGKQLTPEEQRELFGNEWSEEFSREAEQRWGDTQPWRQSRTRARNFGREDWSHINSEVGRIEQRFADLMASGAPPDSPEANAAAREHRDHISHWFYDCDPQMHRCLGETYVADPRFRAHYDNRAHGLAAYLSAAIVAAADDSRTGPPSRRTAVARSGRYYQSTPVTAPFPPGVS
jgi:MerR family transcriptional regulator, thiopeptide resistance regulator